MATPKKPPKKPGRPVVGSRNPTSRPRGVAGRRDERVTAPEPQDADTEETTAADPPSRSAEPPAEPPPAAPTRLSKAAEPEPAAPRSGALSGRRTTPALVVAAVVLTVLAATEGWYLWGVDDPRVTAQRPVVIGEVAHRAAVETAQQSTEDILSYGYQDFDAQIEEATSKMTPAFAERFRETAGDVKKRFVRQRTEQEVRIVAASVVQASPEKVRALLFLDQYVVRPERGTSVTPYRTLVTMVRSDGGWLVDEIETK